LRQVVFLEEVTVLGNRLHTPRAQDRNQRRKH